MACMDDQQPNFKHYCRVCKKGFMCGRALGGHMRAHGIGDEIGGLDDDDLASDWEDKSSGRGGGEIRASNKRMYQLRTNPNRLKSCRTCENCGKEFLSWKSFLEHGKCSWDEASDSLVSSPESDGEEDGGKRGGGWLKRRRSERSKVRCVSTNYLTTDEDDLLLARCLIQLANTTVDPPVVEPEESSASASREEERRNPNAYSRATFDKAKGASKGLFECKACNKVFNSHQALGGHRASHKKVKGCYAAKQDIPVDDNINSAAAAASGGRDHPDNVDEAGILQTKTNSSFLYEQGPALVGAARRKSKVHECTICHRVFTSGQALGGHKRCHWITSNAGVLPPGTSTSLPKFLLQDNNVESVHPKTVDVSGKLDLNVPAWAADTSGVRRDPHNRLSFEVSTEMHLQPWIGPQRHLQLKNKNDIINNYNNKDDKNGKNEMKSNIAVEDEADSQVKLAKLSELNDLTEMGSNGNSSKWLQVGIGSATEAAATASIAAVAEG